MEVATKQDLCAIRARDRHALAGQAFRHHHQHAIALYRRDHRQRVAGIAAGRLDDGIARFEQTLLFSALDHVLGDARLDRAGRIDELELAVDAFNFKQRGIAYRIEDVV